MAPETLFLHATLIRLAKGMVGAVETRFHSAPTDLSTSLIELAKGMISAWELWTYQATGRAIPKEWQRQRELDHALTRAHDLRRRADAQQ